MDINQIIKTVRSRYDHRLHKNLLEEKFKSKLLIVSQGGYWISNPQFISFLAVEQLPDEIHLVVDDGVGVVVAAGEEVVVVEEEAGGDLDDS